MPRSKTAKPQKDHENAQMILRALVFCAALSLPVILNMFVIQDTNFLGWCLVEKVFLPQAVSENIFSFLPFLLLKLARN